LAEQQLKIQISIDTNIKLLISDRIKESIVITNTQPTQPPPPIVETPLPDSESVLFYMDEKILPLCRNALELIKESAKGYKTKVRVIQNKEIVEGKLAYVCYLNSNVQRLEEYPKQLINSISDSNKTGGNVILIAVTPINSWARAKRCFTSTDMEELNEKGPVCSGLFLNDNNKKEYVCCRLIASGDHKGIYPLDACEHNKYNYEHFIDRILYKLFPMKEM